MERDLSFESWEGGADAAGVGRVCGYGSCDTRPGWVMIASMGLRLAPVALTAAMTAVGGAPAQARPFYEGKVTLIGFGPTHDASQGAGWQAVFRERAQGPVRYRVCLTHEVNKASRCWSRTTRNDGSSVVFVALFVSDTGGSGAWHATWLVRGRRVARWDFNVRPESV